VATLEVVTTGEFEEWFDTLDRQEAKSVAKVIGYLQARGVSLGAP